jgi:hypothetical protein
MYVSIRIQGHLDPSWQQRLEGFQIVQEPDGTSRLAGHLPDQPALYGVLAKLSHLSVTLLSLECSDGGGTSEGAAGGCSLSNKRQ